MSKLKSGIVKPFMPEMSPVYRVADLYCVWSVAAAGLVAAIAAFARAYL